MAIDRIPGVGPQNTDIATAVATAVPTIAQITSAVTSNAASAGVTMAAITSAITTNAASAGVTMAAIASSITTNAASAGVTNASITSIVQSNAGSPFAGTWTNLGFQTGNGTTTINWTSLGSYKYLRFFWTGLQVTANNTFAMRINGDTNANRYSFMGLGLSGSSWSQTSSPSNDFFNMNPIGTANINAGSLEIFGSNQTMYKYFRGSYVGGTSGAQQYFERQFLYNQTTAISSISFFMFGDTYTNTGINGMYAWGAN
jgi:hypothetical protein